MSEHDRVSARETAIVTVVTLMLPVLLVLAVLFGGAALGWWGR